MQDHILRTPMQRKFWIGPAALGLVAVVLPAQIQGAPREHVVTMRSMSFGAIPSGVKVGDTIVWVNRDTVPHTATARDKSFDVRIAPRKSVRMTVRKAGAIPFYCVLHPAMRGTLKVSAR